MKRFYYFIIIGLCILTSQYTYAQPSEYSIVGYTIANDEYIITITDNEFVIKDIHDNSDKKIKSANIRMTADKPNKHRCIIIKGVNLESQNSYVIGELCKFFMNEDGIIEIFYKEGKVKRKITLKQLKDMRCIDKDTVITEIEERLNELWDLLPNASDVIKDNYTKEEAHIIGKYNALESFNEFIDALESKEMDLDREINRVWNENSDVIPPENWIEFKNIAKHFFELGLKVNQKGE